MSKAGGKKKSKIIKKLKKRADSWVKEDVQASTSIPPKVDGQLRCYLRLCVNQVLWMIPNSPDLTHVRVQWWGEEGQGTLFRPVDVKRGKKGAVSRTNARFPVRSGPKQLAAYFNDMGSLVLEVLSGPLMVTVGRAQVANISRLAPNHPINGFFSVFSADTEKVAELQVAIVLESLMASYDSSSSIPTPDVSSNIYAMGSNDMQPINPPQVVPAHPPPAYLYSSTDDPFTSPAAVKQPSGRTTPCGIDSQIYGGHNQLRDSVQSRSSALSGHTVVLGSHQGGATDNSQSTVSRERSTTTTHPVTSGGYGADTTPTLEGALGTASTLQGISTFESQLGMSKPDSPRERSLPRFDGSIDAYHKQTTGVGSADLVSMLLQRGGQLREAMIASTINTPHIRSTSVTDMDGVDMGIFSPIKREAPLRRSSTGSFLEEILTHQSPEQRMESHDSAHGRLEQGRVESEHFDQEIWALKMVLGDDFTTGDDLLLHTYHSQSGSDAGNDLSDFGDPLHDENLLEELFYKEVNDDSDVTVSDDDVMKTKTWGVTDMSLMSMDEAANLRPASRSSLDMEPVRDCGHIRSSSPETQVRERSSSAERKRNKRSEKEAKKKKRNNVSAERKRDVSHSPGEKKRKTKTHRDVTTMNESENTDLLERMSLGFTPSEAELLSTVGQTGADPPVEGLSVQRLTLLGRVDVARVVIDRLRLHDEMTSSRETTPTKGVASRGRVKGKPPRPVRTKKASTYFVEYQFPVVTTSKETSEPNIMATEVMRVASKKVVNGDISYSHRSVFPVQFDQESIEKWWTLALVFKIYCRRPNQKVPQLIGVCSVPLKTVLKSEALFLEKIIDIKDRSDPSGQGSEVTVIGNLKVSIELASYGKDFSTALAKTRLAEMTDAKVVPIPAPKSRKSLPAPQSLPNGQEQMATQTEPRPVNLDQVPHQPPPGPPWMGVYGHPQQTSQTPAYQQTGNFETTSLRDYEESLTLHSLLLIPEGVDINPCTTNQPMKPGGKHPQHPVSFHLGRDGATRNLYLVCRMFWCDDVVNSNVCWGTSNPKFNFAQVEPILLTMSLLERLRNNFLVIEVWDKKTSAKSDELVGILKLPLHQFYMSYRDRRIAGSLLKSQYPVVSVDSHMPIVSPFSGAKFGTLKVLLAMGSQAQIGNLQQMMQDKGSAIAVPERPRYCLERQHLYGEARTADDYAAAMDNMVEHIFEVGVESISGLRLRDNVIWGEADCFVQYHFPTQMTSKHQGAPQIMHATPSLKTFRTATTLCIPDPVFNDLVRHKIVLPEGTPVQREILNACAGVGGGAGGVPLEVWCRYYYPNVRDQVIAKTTLPLAKLCALVTMQKRGETNVQTFTLPLSSISISDQDDDPQAVTKIEDSGLLEVTINYKSHILKGVSEVHRPDPVNLGRPGATVCISVGVIRASGLKMAASALARLDQGMQYPAEVGVNTYIRVRMSHLGKEDERVTRTVARTFAPEFNFYLDFPSPLLWTQPDSDALSLAEILETAEVTFDLWHQIPGSDIEVDRHYVNTGSDNVSGRKLVSVSGDVQLGSVTLRLCGLLTHKTGINGWFPVKLPAVGWDVQSEDGRHGNRGIERVVGGLELSLKFGHHDDAERVEQAARGVGWAPDFDIGHRDWDEADELLDHYHQMAVAVDMACFPLQNALVVGQTKLDAAARCYVRYKFYDRNAVCSKLLPLDRPEDDYVSVNVQHSKTLVIPGSSPFTWYLREERLEVQVWVTYTSENAEKQRPRNRDKLIGSAYIDLSSLADTRRRHHRVSDLYPLFKPGASSLGGACIRAHVSLTPRASGYQIDDESEDDADILCMSGRDERKSKNTSPKKKLGLSGDKKVDTLTVDPEETFLVHVSIERALHLPRVAEDGEEVPPSCYVSYQTSNESGATYTDICVANDDPVWKHEHDARFHRDLLTQANKDLVFKVWHKPRGVQQEPDKGVDKVLGFVSVDLALLLRGFHRLTGWYNIINFSGDCQGQIKVSVVPQESLQRFQGLTTPEPTEVSGVMTPLDPTAASHPHFSEHYENVKRCHLRLHDTMVAMGGADPSTASRSILRSNLRDNIQQLDELTNRLKERLQVQSSSSAPFSSSVTHEQSGSQGQKVKGGNDTTAILHTSEPVEYLQPVAPLQPFASDSLDNVHTLATEGATVDGACVYESALKNARQVLQNIDQHMRAGPAAGTLTVSATYELVSGDAVTPGGDACDDTDKTSVSTMRHTSTTRHTHFEEDHGDDTLAPFWNRSYEFDDGDSDDDANDDDVTLVEARPLNDVSSTNFCNGLPDAVLIRERSAFPPEVSTSSSRTRSSVDYSMDEDEYDHRGQHYAPGGSTDDYFGGDGGRFGACSRWNYNMNSNAGVNETGSPEDANGNNERVDNGGHSTLDTGGQQVDNEDTGTNETGQKPTLTHESATHSSGSSSVGEEERHTGNGHGITRETVGSGDQVDGKTGNVRVNGTSSVRSSERSRKSSASSNDSRNRQNPALLSHGSVHSRKSSTDSHDSRNHHNPTSSTHSSEHLRKSSSNSEDSRHRESPQFPSEVVRVEAEEMNEDVFTVDDIDGDASHQMEPGTTPSDSLSPDTARKRPPTSPQKRRETTDSTSQCIPTPAVPNFFLPLPHMEQTMRALQMAMTNDTRGQSHDMNGARDDTKPGPRSVTINDTVSRFSSVPSKSRTQPSAEQAQRIAKIFSQRFA